MTASDGDTKNEASRAAAPYTRPFLTLYDLWVIRLSNRFAWQCPAEVMLGLYNDNLGRRHLEVGPGSGWYLANTDLSATESITLMDLNPVPADFTARRLADSGCAVETVNGNVLEPVPGAAGGGFDSVGVNFLLHCVPGGFGEKGAAFRHLAKVLDDDGCLFGSTILAQTPPTMFGRLLYCAYGRVGAFNNGRDARPELEVALRAAFREYSIAEVGAVTLFVARRPRR